MDGFDQEGRSRRPAQPRVRVRAARESKPYFALAHEFVLADRMFQSHLDESFVSHQYIIAAQAHHAVDLPSGDWGCDGGQTRPVADDHGTAARTGRTSPRASTIRRSPTNSTTTS